MFKRKQDEGEIVKNSIIFGALEVAYIILAAIFSFTAGALFPAGSWTMILGVIAFLILLVISVAVSGLLVLGYPAYLAFEKNYHEALVSLVVILGVMVLVFCLLILGGIPSLSAF